MLLTPHLCVANAEAFIDFCQRAFGATEVRRSPEPNGTRLMHAELTIGGSRLMLHDDFPEMSGGKSNTAQALGATPVVFNLTVENADAAWARAIAAGATERFPLADQFWGDRYGQVADPFGNVWAIQQPKEQLTQEQIQERMANA